MKTMLAMLLLAINNNQQYANVAAESTAQIGVHCEIDESFGQKVVRFFTGDRCGYSADRLGPGKSCVVASGAPYNNIQNEAVLSVADLDSCICACKDVVGRNLTYSCGQGIEFANCWYNDINLVYCDAATQLECSGTPDKNFAKPENNLIIPALLALWHCRQ